MLSPRILKQPDKIGGGIFSMSQTPSVRYRGVEPLARGPQLEKTGAGH